MRSSCFLCASPALGEALLTDSCEGLHALDESQVGLADTAFSGTLIPWGYFREHPISQDDARPIDSYLLSEGLLDFGLPVFPDSYFGRCLLDAELNAMAGEQLLFADNPIRDALDSELHEVGIGGRIPLD